MADVPLVVWGADHHRSPVELRERLAVAGGDAPALAALLRQVPGATEAVVLATCNRLECAVAGSPERRAIESLLCERAGVDPHLLARHAYWHTGDAAARQVLRVTAGLESMVLGEAEIAGQVRRAYEACRAAGTTGTVLNVLFQRALACGKDVRSRTGLGDHKLSVASVAVDLARQVHGDLAAARLLVVGAGETAELALRYLIAAGVTSVIVVNRSPNRAAELAQRHGAATQPWDQLAACLALADVVVSSTAAPHPVISLAMVRSARGARRRPLALIDLAVPRDVAPEVGTLDDVFLFNVDHLEQVVAGNRRLRHEEVAAAEALVEAAVADWHHTADASHGELLAQVAGLFRDVVTAEEARLAAKLGPGVDRAQLRYGLERVGNKLLHPILTYLKDHADDPEATRAIRGLLGLERPGSSRPL